MKSISLIRRMTKAQRDRSARLTEALMDVIQDKEPDLTVGVTLAAVAALVTHITMQLPEYDQKVEGLPKPLVVFITLLSEFAATMESDRERRRQG